MARRQLYNSFDLYNIILWHAFFTNKSVQYHGILNTVSHVPVIEALSVIETL